ncbi:TPA_exp: Endo-1,3(4)-beta-glucanase [Trichophyton benhamiae CBS 112371]|uniref:Endo-1,3(4)-beta-glucanase ARB_04519 n=1 Tax=Arthroderma benhamiae (strain ATCC MYA-4681 / CBS 112371) TaxID=663331 RepID=EGLX_ARTBC|nr:endo-1,3(4)-beta-glucanase, putative [Trichophyton benhamiae CBS 112371]D4AJR9.1 RecName: Full=Endo-1,3(4)-beta-glucanase ARB_04519; Flags: Precursor [Trichophyton benhamiae CBS 112371]EFE36992.1 endo-1,3(4)-beta-glucanase, putative [Trichophyton benhamiae CBS 112371]DAA79734.1 TPA_exp: Endo-1,3(4)-beta-glucanase [Trichophyton benhamiae CBS 112371]
MRTTGLLLLGALAELGSATYILEDDYQPNTWFDQFRFFSAKDPTHAYVNYLDQAEARSQNLIGVRNNAVYLGVDHKNVATGEGRSSVRLETKKVYNHGLIVADINHMPGGECGTWPAFWTTSSAWPMEGELDIIEGVNQQKQNDYALHTAQGCSIPERGDFTGSVVTPNCDVKALGQAENQGCLVEDTKGSRGYGPDFNNATGGVFATEWTDQAISIWFFPREDIPKDVNSEHPDPSKWGKPSAFFGGGECPIGKHVRNQRIIFNTAFCGGWADGMWPGDPICSKKAPTCMEYVRENPSAFEDAYWSINYMKVYQQGTAPTKPSQAPAPPSSTPALPTMKSTSTVSSMVSATQPAPTASNPTGAPMQPSSSSSNNGPQPTGGNGNPGDSCPPPTQPACRTYVTTKTYTLVSTMMPSGPQTTGGIVPVPSAALEDIKDTAQRLRRRDMERHSRRGHHN